MNKLFSFFLFSIAILTALLRADPIYPNTRACSVDVCETPLEVATRAAEIFQEEVNKAKALEQKLVFILPTGGTTIPFYKKLVEFWNEGKLDLSNVTTYNLDEYVGLSKDDLQSYDYFMKHYFFDLVTDTLTLEKLRSFGLVNATKDDLNHAQLDGIDPVDINYAIDLLKREIVEAFSICEYDDYTSIHDTLKRIDAGLKRKNSVYSLVSHYLLIDNKFPSFTTLALSILNHFELKHHAIAKDRVYIPNGSVTTKKEIQKSVRDYKLCFEKSTEEGNTRVVTFCGIGVDPAHIAFNDLLSEKEYQDTNLSEDVLTKRALHSSFRLVPLTEETRRVNSRFFDFNMDSVPTHALTLGFDELLRSDRFILLAFGTNKARALYRTFAFEKPTYKIPSSLIRYMEKTTPELIVDKKAFGLDSLDQECLAKLLHNTEEKKLATFFHIESKKQGYFTFEDIPNLLRPSCVLNETNSFTKNNINLVTVPKDKKILWIYNNDTHHSQLLEQLAKNNIIVKVHFKNFQGLEKVLQEETPEYLYLPEYFRKKKNERQLSKLLKSFRYADKVLAIYYPENSMKKNLTTPLTKITIDRKVHALQKFHTSQVKRTSFDQIVWSLAKNSTVTVDEKEYPSEVYYLKKYKANKSGSITLSSIPNSVVALRDIPMTKLPKSTKKLHFGVDDLVIIAAPHPDDAEIGMGGLLHELSRQNINTTVLNVTPGFRAEMRKSDLLSSAALPEKLLRAVHDYPHEKIMDRDLKKNIRFHESSKAIEYLHPRAEVRFLNMPFYEAKGYEYGNKDKEIIDRNLDDLISQRDGNIYLFVPRKHDEHKAHRQTNKIFTERLKHYFRAHPDKSIYIGFYTTPWTGEWNLYYYNQKEGSALAAISGSERLLKSGARGYLPKFLGGLLAERFYVDTFHLKK